MAQGEAIAAPTSRWIASARGGPRIHTGDGWAQDDEHSTYTDSDGKSTETDVTNAVHMIEVKFPAPENPPKGIEFRDGVRLSIPVAKLPAAKLPAKGGVFAFRGTLRKEKADALFEPVWVFYGLGPNAGKVLVGVDLQDVEPIESK